MKVATAGAGKLLDKPTLRRTSLTSKYLGRRLLIFALGMALSTSAEAQTSKMGDPIHNEMAMECSTASCLNSALDFTKDKWLIGLGAAVVVVATVVIIHKSSGKRTITGCVSLAENAMSVTDDKDKRLYTLSGDTAGIKPGDRMTLQVKKIKLKGAGKTLAWKTIKIKKDLCVCQPSS
jgi:hypothetical protein